MRIIVTATETIGDTLYHSDEEIEWNSISSIQGRAALFVAYNMFLKVHDDVAKQIQKDKDNAEKTDSQNNPQPRIIPIDGGSHRCDAGNTVGLGGSSENQTQRPTSDMQPECCRQGRASGKGSSEGAGA